MATLPAVVGGARNIFLAIRLSGLSLLPNFPSSAPLTPFINSYGDGVRCGDSLFLFLCSLLGESHSEVGPSSIPCSTCVTDSCQTKSLCAKSQFLLINHVVPLLISLAVMNSVTLLIIDTFLLQFQKKI